MIGERKVSLGCKCDPECREVDLELICTADGIHHEYQCSVCGGMIVFVVEPDRPVTGWGV